MPDKHHTYLRFTVNAIDYAYADDELLRNGVWHEARLLAAIRPRDPFVDELGIARHGTVNVQLVDMDGVLMGLDTSDDLDGLECVVELVTNYKGALGADQESSHTQTMLVAGYTMTRGAFSLRLEDLEADRLDQLWPPNVYDTTEFPNMLEAQVGSPVPDAVGTALKFPCVLYDTTTDWKYSVCEKPAAGTPTVLTLYRNNRIIDPSEYTTATFTTGGGLTVVNVTFTQEQLDFNGGYFDILADVSGVHSRNVADEIQRLLEAVGATVNAASFATAQTYATTTKMLLDCDYGQNGRRRVRAILRDLLFIARGTLSRNATGEYVLTQDKTGAAISAYDEDKGDNVSVISRQCESRPVSVSLQYRPSPQDPANLQHVITRNVTGGRLAAAAPRMVRYMRDHEGADRLLDYLAKRTAFNRRVKALVLNEQHLQMDVISLLSGRLIDAAADYQVRGVRRIRGGNELELLQHSDSIHTYTPGTLPTDATLGYLPDYSQTPPAAPTALAILSEAVVVDSEGFASSEVVVDIQPPAVNYQNIWFLATNSTTGEVVLVQGVEQGGGSYRATVTGLKPNYPHTLQAWAQNAFGLDGAVVSTFDVTAIGGGAADTSFTSKAYTSAPATPAGSTVLQGTGKSLHYSWTYGGTLALLREFVVERSSGGSFVEVWRGKATRFSDKDVTYGTTHTYHVKAIDNYGNESGVSANATILGTAFDGNVNAPDVMDNVIDSDHRTVVSTLSMAYSIPPDYNGRDTGSLSHGIGKVPLITPDFGSAGFSDLVLIIQDTNASTIWWTVYQTPVFDGSGAAVSHVYIPGPNRTGSVIFKVW